MAYSNKNVIVGAAALYISVKDSTEDGWVSGAGVTLQDGPKLPNFVANESAALKKTGVFETSADWRAAGYTTDGIEVSYEPDYGEVTVDQALDSVKMFKQGMRVSVNTTLSEATLENLILAWGQKSTTLTGDSSEGEDHVHISGGELGDEPVERSIAFVGPAPRSAAADNKKRERVYHLRRSLQVESSAHSLSRTDATTFPVSFRCLPDDNPNLSGGNYGNIIQRVIS